MKMNGCSAQLSYCTLSVLCVLWGIIGIIDSLLIRTQLLTTLNDSDFFFKENLGDGN